MYGWEFPPHISGGLGVACYELTQALAAAGHDISFVLPRLKPGATDESHVRLVDMAQFAATGEGEVDEDERRVVEDVELTAVDSPLRPYVTDAEYREVLSRLEQTTRTPRGGSQGYDLALSGDYGVNLVDEVMRYARTAGALARRIPHDVVHAHDWLTMLAGAEAKRVSKKPLVVHVHALEFDRSGDNVNQAVYDIERAGMHAADRVAAVSGLTRDTIVRRYGVAPDKVVVVHNGVTRRSTLGPPPPKEHRDKVVLFLGRVTFQKGPDYFVEAAARVLEKRNDVRFVMAGSGDMLPRMIERVAQLGIGKRFHFTGFLAGPWVERMYRESDVYVMPSVSEPFGISPLEAMCHDVPTIISRQSGVSEVLRHALRVDFWNVDELANKILALLAHPPLAAELRRCGRQELEGIHWGRAAERLSGMYAELQRAA
jgi:glycosyltransferase involved in cell wall biosynthesis